MVRGSGSGSKGPLWHGYRRPVWRDKVFWLAFGTSIAGLLVQNAFGNFEATGRGWAILGLEVVVTFAIVFALIGVVAGTFRGFGEGWRQAEEAAAPPRPTARPAPAAAPVDPGVEAASTPATPVTVESESIPIAARDPEPVAEPEPTPAPEPAVSTAATPAPEPTRPDPPAPDRPKAGVEMERQARRLARAIGAGRRTYKKYDGD